MKQNKDHWYDGLFYDIIIAPSQDKSFRLVKNIIEENSSVVDIGCGTGRLEFQLADKCKKVDGVDLSKRNIDLAKRKLNKTDLSNVSFFHYDVNKYFEEENRNYDYAVISYMIHEVDERLRIDILEKIAAHVDKIIIVDYLVPRPKSFWSYLNEAVEFLAGKDHYNNFKNYVENNGIKGLVEKSGLRIVKEIKNTPETSHIAILQK